MTGQGRALAVLGGLLALGIGAALWVLSDDGHESADSKDEPEAGAPDEAVRPAEGGKAAPKKNTKRVGAASVVGEVRRTKGKAPVADQEVRLVPEKGEPWTTKTDAAGAFSLPNLPHGVAFELRVAAPSCGTIRIPGLVLERNEQRSVGTLWLDPAVKLPVEVRSSADQPVEGATVEAFAILPVDNSDGMRVYSLLAQTPTPVAKATSDAQGIALFPELSTGRWTFLARKDGFGRGGKASVSLRPDIPAPPVKIHLGKGYPLSGRVLDAANKPVEGVPLLAGVVMNQMDPAWLPLRSRAVSDAQGRYEFAGLEAGDASLSVTQPGGAFPTSFATLRIPDVSQFDIHLKAMALVEGTVTEKEGGKPVEGATIRANSWRMGAGGMAQATTDAQGKYALSIVPGTLGYVSAEKEGMVPADDAALRQQVQVREGETVRRDVLLRPGSKVSGVVRGPEGPLPAVKVWVITTSVWGGTQQKSALSDAEGRYEVGPLSPGRAIVRADLAGWYVKDFPDNWGMLLQQPGPSPFRVELPAGGSVAKDLEMIRGQTVEGRVESPTGPLEGVRVTTYADMEGGVLTGADGSFRLEGVKPAGSVWLSLVREGWAPAATNKAVTVTADAPTTGVVLRMNPFFVVRGTVTAADGAPLVDAKVYVASWVEDRGSFPGGRPQGGNANGPVRPDGTYELQVPGQAGGKCRVTATSVGRAPSNAENLTFEEGRSEYVVDLKLDVGKSLEGRVTSKQGGAPIEGALVTMQKGGPVNYEHMGGGAGTIWAVTDADGRFVLSHMSTGPAGVGARADGFVAGTATADLATTSQVAIELQPELTIEGTIAFADGTPVEAANVSALRDEPAAKSGGPRPGQGPGTNAWTMSGGGGRFRLPGLTPGPYRITVATNWQGDLNFRTKKTEPVMAGTSDLRIVVEEGGVIAGRVLDPQKRPLPNLNVNASPELQGGQAPEGVDGRAARTKEDGTFTLVGLAGGFTYVVNVQPHQGWDAGAAAYKPAVLKNVAPGTKNLEIVLEEGLQVSGVVVTADGKPIVNTYVWCNWKPVDGKSGRQNRNAMTDSNGAFTFSGLDEGECQINIAENPATPGLVLVDADKIPAGTKGLRLVAAKGVTITGSVVDEANAPVKQGFVNANPKGGGQNRGTQIKPDGTFELTGLLSGGTYSVLAQSPGRVPVRQEDVPAGAADVRLVLAKGLETTGRLLDERGDPLRHASISANYPNEPVKNVQARTDEQGRFTLTGMLDAVYELTVYVQDKNQWRKCGTLKGGAAAGDVRVPPQ
jgi:uncharacterized GH25 family protein